jgi:hypothetical protein
VTVWSACLQDDSNPGNVCLFNALTGEYRFCYNGVAVASGTGTVTVRDCIVSISHATQERRVQMTADLTAKRGTATIIINGQLTYQIADRDTSNNSCACGG